MSGSVRCFDASFEQSRLNTDPHYLKRVISKLDKADSSQRMVWNWARSGLTTVVYALICEAEAAQTAKASEVIVSLAHLSLEREEWHGWTEIVPEEDFYRRGGRNHIDHPDRPEAFIAPNLVLLRDHWLKTGRVDHERVTSMFAQPMSVPVVQGIMDEIEIMPYSAWEEIRVLRDLPDPGGHKRPNSTSRRIGHILAEDPAQLHDPKSPVRKRARSYMRTSMSDRWLAGGLAVEAMDWLMTFEWREGESGLSPREVMLRAYAYMPEVEPPPNIAREVEQLRKLPI